MESLVNFVAAYRKYLIELGLLLAALLIVAASALLYLFSREEVPRSKQAPAQIEEVKETPTDSSEEESVIIDITGAVMKPDSYKLPGSARLKDALTQAGGLSELADKDFFYRNYNLAEHLYDQEKIYIPSLIEVSSGIFKENYRLLSPDSPQITPVPTGDSPEKVHLNSSSLEELDSLPGIGSTTAQKIIDNRPYTQLDALIDKKVVGQAVFNKIKELIDL
jgi:competence protein ComEA